ncbi:MAG TPA: rhomboid family intramembrane serine protease [Thermoanaerobaculia bacterium]|nr:rhomboid family intramembrane serine protease [Thermoanaerobaculia bacterium]
MKGENLHSVFILLFLTIALFFLEYQDAERYAALFAFDAEAVLSGEVWRVVTYQFTQSGQGWFSFPRAIVLFFTLLLLYIMGSAVEETWGTRRFLTLFAISTITTAAAASLLGIALLGSYFVNFSLLFVYAAMFPQQTFYIFAMIPVRIQWIAWVAAVLLVAGVFAGGAANTAALAGSIASYLYFVLLRARAIAPVPAPRSQEEESERGIDSIAIRNAARFVAVKKAIATRSEPDIDRLTKQFERDTVQGVNVCPPADYKPENNDGYCIRCEGFSECSARYLAMNRPAPRPVADGAAVAET